jgi:fumarate reductase subunit D
VEAHRLCAGRGPRRCSRCAIGPPTAMSWGARWARLYSPLVVALSVAVVVLVVAVAFRLGFISAPSLVQNKDLVDVGTKLLGTVIITLGAIASYFRFFKGRTLSPRLKIHATVEVFPIDSSRNFHVLSVEVANVGSVAIWGLEPRVEIRYHGDEERMEEDLGDWWTPLDHRDSTARLRMLDTEESSQFVVHREVPRNVWAVTYFTRVSLSSGHSWHRIITASNRVEEDRK